MERFKKSRDDGRWVHSACAMCLSAPMQVKVKNYVVHLHNLLEESTLVERKSFIRSFVKEVRVAGAKALMTYTIPMPPKQLSQETLVVPPIVHYGGQ